MAFDIRTQSHPVDRYRLTTDEFASQQLVEPQTVRKQYSASGSYHGIRPLRLPNRKLLWPDNAIERLAAEQLGDAGIDTVRHRLAPPTQSGARMNRCEG